VLQKAWLPILVSWTRLSKGSPRKGEAGREVRRISALERAGSLERGEHSPKGTPQGASARDTEIRILTMRGHGPHQGNLAPGQPGETRPGATAAGNRRDRLDDDTVNADWSDGSARGRIRDSRVCPRVIYFVLQISESTSSPQEAPALTFVLRKRRGDHRWTQAGASSAATSERILIQKRIRGQSIERCSGECESSAVG
jgi:hypothetical protein